MFSRVRKKDEPTSTSLAEYVMDSADDVSSLPTNFHEGANGEDTCYPGSQAYTADIEHVYVLSPSGVWKEI